MKYILLLFLLCLSRISFPQISDNLSLLVKAETNKVDIKQKYHVHKSSNEIEFILSKSFLMYKRFVSSQDISSCNFTPSCSEYAFEAIRKQGLVIGIINFFDRFSRCNGMNAEHYHFLSDKHLLYDPVKNFKGEVIKDE